MRTLQRPQHAPTSLLRGSLPSLIVVGGQESGTLSCRGGFILPDRSRHRCALEAPSLTDLCHETRAHKGAEASQSCFYAARTYRAPLEIVSRKQLTSADSLVVLSIVCLLARSAVPPSRPELIPPPLSRFHGTPVAHLGAESLLTNGPFRPRNVKPHNQHHSLSRLFLSAHLGRFDPREPTPVHTVAPCTWTADVHIPPGASGISCSGLDTPTRSQTTRISVWPCPPQVCLVPNPHVSRYLVLGPSVFCSVDVPQSVIRPLSGRHGSGCSRL